MVGARLHIPFPVAMRSSFGWYFSRFPVVVRGVTALFWHAIQTYTGSTAMTQCIRAIWPSYLTAIPNHIPDSVGITSQQMVSHLIFWLVQFPILLTPPHKLKWFFVFKAGMYTSLYTYSDYLQNLSCRYGVICRRCHCNDQEGWWRR
jgi:NCS1 family nucleobase:cation symporter-1